MASKIELERANEEELLALLNYDARNRFHIVSASSSSIIFPGKFNQQGSALSMYTPSNIVFGPAEILRISVSTWLDPALGKTVARVVDHDLNVLGTVWDDDHLVLQSASRSKLPCTIHEGQALIISGNTQGRIVVYYREVPCQTWPVRSSRGSS